MPSVHWYWSARFYCYNFQAEIGADVLVKTGISGVEKLIPYPCVCFVQQLVNSCTWQTGALLVYSVKWSGSPENIYFFLETLCSLATGSYLVCDWRALWRLVVVWKHEPPRRQLFAYICWDDSPGPWVHSDPSHVFWKWSLFPPVFPQKSQEWCWFFSSFHNNLLWLKTQVLQLLWGGFFCLLRRNKLCSFSSF